jgi:hypothetical protein
MTSERWLDAEVIDTMTFVPSFLGCCMDRDEVGLEIPVFGSRPNEENPVDQALQVSPQPLV